MALATPSSLRDGLAAGDLSAEGLVQAGMDRIHHLDPRLRAVLSVDAPRSLAQARRADARLALGERGPVLGLPIVLKDNLHWKGAPCTSGSRILEGYRAPYDATVVGRLLAAGAVPLAKANMDEFAMGSSGEFSAFGPARNPWDVSRVPGGSSSGSAVSVAAGYAPFALGSDTGGSVRLPASFCNLTALRPTYGVLSRHGVTAMASSLDQVGPIARTAEDVAALLSVMAGADPLDATSVDLPRKEALWPLKAASLAGLKIGLPREYFGEGLDAGVRDVIQKALQTFLDAGAHLVEVDLPHTRYAIDAYYLICTSEVSSNLSRFDGLRYGLSLRAEGQSLPELMARTRNAGFGAEAKRRILLGTFSLSKGHYDAFYLKALKARTLIRRDFLEAFRLVDVLATPVSPTVAFPLGAKLDDPLAMHLADIYAVAAPLAGLPALAFPAGFSAGLPVGMQLMGPALSDVRLLELVQAFQERTDDHLRTPDL
ncbi:MAG TPA: Asp-tRNA(Asn)/Glu-tRNA(Gln) amidotransferase subunit GatA [Holophagaceae bacterium]|nr:Asp-tRNA(Asn)/Glu-tRNA(Gln) amidotransferase subunit GatA [Holophagaceae bacterium]